MYECLIERIADSHEEMSESYYHPEEVAAFKAYVILAQADEEKRRLAFAWRRTVKDYSPEEIARFDHMHEVLTEFNRLVDDPDIEMDKIIPLYSDSEMAEYSQYREILLGHIWRLENDTD